MLVLKPVLLTVVLLIIMNVLSMALMFMLIAIYVVVRLGCRASCVPSKADTDEVLVLLLLMAIILFPAVIINVACLLNELRLALDVFGASPRRYKHLHVVELARRALRRREGRRTSLVEVLFQARRLNGRVLVVARLSSRLRTRQWHMLPVLLSSLTIAPNQVTLARLHIAQVFGQHFVLVALLTFERNLLLAHSLAARHSLRMRSIATKGLLTAAPA